MCEKNKISAKNNRSNWKVYPHSSTTHTIRFQRLIMPYVRSTQFLFFVAVFFFSFFFPVVFLKLKNGWEKKKPLWNEETNWNSVPPVHNTGPCIRHWLVTATPTGKYCPNTVISHQRSLPITGKLSVKVFLLLLLLFWGSNRTKHSYTGLKKTEN